LKSTQSSETSWVDFLDHCAQVSSPDQVYIHFTLSFIWTSGRWMEVLIVAMENISPQCQQTTYDVDYYRFIGKSGTLFLRSKSQGALSVSGIVFGDVRGKESEHRFSPLFWY